MRDKNRRGLLSTKYPRKAVTTGTKKVLAKNKACSKRRMKMPMIAISTPRGLVVSRSDCLSCSVKIYPLAFPFSACCARSDVCCLAKIIRFLRITLAHWHIFALRGVMPRLCFKLCVQLST